MGNIEMWVAAIGKGKNRKVYKETLSTTKEDAMNIFDLFYVNPDVYYVKVCNIHQ